LNKIYQKKIKSKLQNIFVQETSFEINTGLFKYNQKIKRSYQNLYVAHRIYIELVTRKAAIPIDVDKDVLVEVYNSWYSMFKTIREEIKNLPVKNIAADNAHLYMWVTNQYLLEAKEVIKAWGFKYSTVGFTWVKTTKNNKYFFGLGYWTRANPEICLIAKKGSIKRLSKKIPNLIVDQIREHSRKPDITRTNIVELCGDLPRIELFARQRVDGWDNWGNQV
jgi:N6-adenosine-specific RNA methylase IME4